MAPTLQYASFLIRLWRQESADLVEHPVEWQSEVEHIQTGDRWSFGSLDELLAWSFGSLDEVLAFLRDQAGDRERARPVLSQR